MRRACHHAGISGHRQRFAAVATVAAVAVCWATAGATAGAHQTQPTWRVLATGLDNPRGLAVGEDGEIFVAEAGRGGAGPCGVAAGGEPACFGATGAVTRITEHGAKRIVTGLPSIAGDGGTSATGPHDVAIGRSGLDVLLGFGGTPDERAVFGPEANLLGRLVHVERRGQVREVADLLAYEAANNPDGGAVESNGYSVISWRGSRLVSDAGANALLRVSDGDRGAIATVATFPDRTALAPDFLGLPPGTEIPMQAVPDAVAAGPDGALYVGELTGFPFPPGAARIYRVPPGGAPTVFADGFTNVIDIAFGPRGSLYVLEIAASGLLSDSLEGILIRVARNGTRTTVATGLTAPTSIAVGEDGTIYVSNFGIFAGTGEVVALRRAER